jgi:hypothetical protein
MLQFRDAIVEPLNFLLERIDLLLVVRDQSAQLKLIGWDLDLLVFSFGRASH